MAIKKVSSVKKGFNAEAKIETIKKSKMPNHQKEELIKKINGKSNDAGKIRFGAYANRKGLSKAMRSAMQAYPAAKGVASATESQWDEIFKKF